ncbi:MAG TPA: hypothetical protein VMT88_09370 [Actinomycetes bacterium]|nr:hypothetical protein [Actinomycetes bacterium]
MKSRVALRLTIGIAYALALAGCTGPAPSSGGVDNRGMPEPTTMLSAASTYCFQGIVRTKSIPTSRLLDGLDGHAPTWLPKGFGLADAHVGETPTDGFSGGWSDARCRLVSVSVSQGDSLPTGYTAMGKWTIVNTRGGCFNEVLGKARCLNYWATVEGRLVTVQMMGLGRQDGDRIVRSIA